MGFPQNEKLSEGLGFPNIMGYYGTLTTAQVSAAVDMSKARKAIFFVQGFTLGSAATVTAKLQGCATSGGSYTDIANSSVTLVKATDDNKWTTLEISADYLNSLGLSYRFVKLSVGADVSSAVGTLCIQATGPNEPVSTYVNSTATGAAGTISLV